MTLTRDEAYALLLNLRKEVQAHGVRLTVLEKRDNRRATNTRSKQTQRDGTSSDCEKHIADTWIAAYGKGVVPGFLFACGGPLKRLINNYGQDEVLPVLAEYFRRTTADLVSLPKFAGSFEARQARLRGNGQAPTRPYEAPEEWTAAQEWVKQHGGAPKAAQEIRDYAKANGLLWGQAFGPLGIPAGVGAVLKQAGEGPKSEVTI